MLLTELKHAFRSLRRRPGFLLLGASALGLGLAASVLVFMAVNTLLLRPLPGINSTQELVEIGRLSRDGGFDTFSHPDFVELREQSRTLDKVYAWRMAPVYAESGDAPQRALALLVSGDYFQALGVGTAHGRLLAPHDDGAPGASPVVVASHAAFQRLFAGDPAALGATITLNGRAYTLVGVAAPEFRGNIAALAPDFFVPLNMSAALRIGRAEDFERRGSRSLLLGGRLRDDASLAQVNAELAALGTSLAERFPDSHLNTSFAAEPLRPLPQGAQGMLKMMAGTLFVLCAAILALACSNLAGVLLARGESRSSELAMCNVLGAGRGRIALQLFCEATLVALVAGVLALALVFAGRGVLNLLPMALPFAVDLSLAFDWRVVLFCFAATGIVALGFGALPALRISALAPGRNAQQNALGARGPRQLLRHGLLAGQAALTIALLLTAALVLRALDIAGTIDTGFRTEGVYTADVDLTPTGRESAEAAGVLEQLGDRLEQHPGVTRASFASVVPLTMSRLGYGGARVPGSEQAVSLDVNTVGDGFFDVFGLAVKGRPIADSDAAAEHKVAVINRVFARQLFGDTDPLGNEFEIGYGDDWERIRIVGVVADGRYASMSDTDRPFAFLAAPQWERTEFSLVIQADLGADALRQLIAAEMRTLLPGVPPPPVHAFADSAALSILPQRILGGAATALGALALLLAATGLYGVLAFQVERRVREFGLRKALGAPAARIAASLMQRSAIWLLAGAAVGVALGQLASIALADMLFGIGGADPVALGGVLLVFAAMVALAIALPLGRALRLEPMEALRHN